MKILNQERYDEMIAHTEKTGDESLQNCLDSLKRREEEANGRYEVELLWDHAPLSMLFRQVCPDGTTDIVGGLIYHGSPDESFSFQITPCKGWQIHT